MYSTFLTASPGSVLFSRSTLLKRKDLCFSCLRLGLIRHRRILRFTHLFSSGLTRLLSRHPLEPARPRLMASSLSASLFHRFSSVPDLSLIFLEFLRIFILSYFHQFQLLISILSKCFPSSNESNQKAINPRSQLEGSRN
jgi:hypothetical protein